MVLRTFIAAVLWSTTLLGITAASADDGSPRKVALLVGVNKYLKPGFRDLEFAEADVQAVSAELSRLGFEVTVLLGSAGGSEQATLSNMEAAAHRMVEPLGKDDLALVMLSGHGQTLRRSGAAQDLDESFYCPVDARVNDPATQFSLSHLLDDLLAPNVGRKLVLVDACRDVPVDAAKGARNIKGIEGRVVSLPEDTSVFFSCRAGQTSFERQELGHGLFTYCVLEGLRGKAVAEGEVSWSSLVAHVGRRMTQPDLTRYVPREYSQVPIFAGAMPHTVLGVVDAAAVRPSTDMPSRAAEDRDRVLQSELQEFELALRISVNEARRYIAERAGRRLREWQTAAAEGSGAAQFLLARCRQQGVGGPEDLPAAMDLYRQAADAGIPLAWNSLGAAYETGRGMDQDWTIAADCYRRAGELGCATAMINLGDLYGSGAGVPESKTQQFAWYLRAAEAGEPGAMRDVGKWYEEGARVQRDYQQARLWYERAAAQGDAIAMNDLGVMYDDGKGVGKDDKEAMRYFQMSAARGNAWAMNNIGKLYYNGEGVEQDSVEGVRWLRKSWAALGTLSGDDYKKLYKLLQENFEAANASP